MRVVTLIAFAFLVLSAGRVEAAPVGPIPLRPAVALYVVCDGTPCEARIIVRQGPRPTPERLMARVFTPDERLLFWRYVEYVPAKDQAGITSPGIELRDAAHPPTLGDLLLDETVRLNAAGIYQIRLVGGAQNSTAEVILPRDLPYGISCQNGTYSPWDAKLSSLYAYVPPRAEELTVVEGPAVVRDAQGKELAQLEPGKQQAIPVTQTETVWRFDLPDPKGWQLRAAGFPLILCTTAEAARAIRASVEVLPDGTVVCHQFQRRIAEMLPRLLDPAKVGTAEKLIVPLATRKEAWLAHPIRATKLMQAFLPMVEHWLRRQNVDPASHWGGSLNGWQEFAGKPGREGRWDRLKAIQGLYAGASDHYGGGAEHLALAALHDDPTNPYFGRQELLYRAAAAALRDLMVLSESEVFPGVADLDPYPGMMAFALGQKTLPVFGTAAPHLPTEVRALWAEGLRRVVDRCLPDDLVSARNQSSHYLVAYHAYATGSGDPLYRDMARLFARRWIRGQHPSGFHQEATGPCPSYIGMTHWHEAVYYRMSKDPEILESLRRSYAFFNHTVAPEPDGRMLGGFNFAHRVGEGFYLEQYGGARGILGDVLPEVGLWAGPAPSPEEEAKQRADAMQHVERFLAEPTLPRYPDIGTPRYLYHAEPDRSATWPAREPGSFVRNLSNELVAVKRPGYYAVIYVGKPAAGEFYIRKREDLRLPFPGGIEENGGVLPEVRNATPFLGGGLTGFWTPEYGHSVMAAAWSPTTHHGVMLTAPDGKRYWEDYFAHTFELDEAAGTLVISGRIEGWPLAYRRAYRFGDDALEVVLTLTAEKEMAARSLVENIPFARGGWKARGATLSAGEKHAGEASSDRLTVTDSTGAGIEIRFDQPRALLLVPEGLKAGGWRDLQFGRAEVRLPEKLAAGQTIELRYTIRPIAAPKPTG